MTIYSLDVLLSRFRTSLLFHVWFYLLLLDLHTDFSGGRSGGLVFPSLEEFSTICCDPTVKGSVMSNSVRLHRRQPTRLTRPWDSPGKNTGVGCHCLLQCMKVKSESEAAQSCPTVSDPMDCSLPGSSVHGIFQARKLEWVAMPSSICRN